MSEDTPAVARPDPACAACQGKGYVRAAPASPPQECDCLLLQRARLYLTPRYVDASRLRDFDAAPLIGRDVLIQNTNAVPAAKHTATCRAIVKSFLLRTGMAYAHRTVSAYDVLQANLNNSEHGRYTALASIDLLILHLGGDPRNKLYAELLSYLVDARAAAGRPTWLCTPYRIDDPVFQAYYGEDFTRFLKAGKRFLELAP